MNTFSRIQQALFQSSDRTVSYQQGNPGSQSRHQSKPWQSFVLAALTVFFFQTGMAWGVMGDSAMSASDMAQLENGNSQRGGSLSVKERLMARAKEKGSVRLIVQLDADVKAQGGLSGIQALAAQKTAVAQTQTEVLDWLAFKNVKNLKRYQYISGMAMEVDAEALEILQTNPHVISFYEDKAVPPTLLESVPLIQANEVWELGVDGTGQAVAILDTGVDSSHEFLNGKVVSEACYSTTSELAGSLSVCPNGLHEQVGPGAGVNCPLGISGCNHGTHVAGIAAGRGSSLGFDGVAHEANIIAIQVFSRFDDAPSKGYFPCKSNEPGRKSPCVLTYYSDQISGLDRVYQLRHEFQIAAVNMSLGGGRHEAACDAEFKDHKSIIDKLRAVGIATVVASGNDYYTDAIGDPACISSAIAVGSTTKFDSISDFSNSAEIVDLLAPGSAIRSSVPNGTATYSSFNGTSMAAPHVAGAFALLKQANGLASVDDMLEALKNTGVPVTDNRAGVSNTVTKPRINVKAAVDQITLVPSIQSPLPESELIGSTVTFTGQSAVGEGAASLPHKLWVGTFLGDASIFAAGPVDRRTFTVDNFPAGTLYVRYWTQFGTGWQFQDHTYQVSAGTPDLVIQSLTHSPENPTTVDTITVKAVVANTGNSAAGPSTLEFKIGEETVGVNFDIPALSPNATHTIQREVQFDSAQTYQAIVTADVTNVVVEADETNNSESHSFSVTKLISHPALLSPAPESTLRAAQVTFTGEDPSGSLQHYLYVGTSKGGYNIAAKNMGTNPSVTISGLPTSGIIYVTYWTRLSNGWVNQEHTYKMDVNVIPQITSPTSGMYIYRNSSFQGQHFSGNTQHWVYVGTYQGGNDVLSFNLGTQSSFNLTNLPGNTIIWVRYWSRLSDGSWVNSDHQYKTLSD